MNRSILFLACTVATSLSSARVVIPYTENPFAGQTDLLTAHKIEPGAGLPGSPVRYAILEGGMKSMPNGEMSVAWMLENQRLCVTSRRAQGLPAVDIPPGVRPRFISYRRDEHYLSGKTKLTRRYAASLTFSENCTLQWDLRIEVMMGIKGRGPCTANLQSSVPFGSCFAALPEEVDVDEFQRTARQDSRPPAPPAISPEIKTVAGQPCEVVVDPGGAGSVCMWRKPSPGFERAAPGGIPLEVDHLRGGKVTASSAGEVFARSTMFDMDKAIATAQGAHQKARRPK